MLAAAGPRALGAARTAFCLGLTLFILISGAAYFLSGAPGERSWLSGILESVGLVGDGSGDAPGAGARAGADVTASARGPAERGGASADARHGDDGESDAADGAAFGLFPGETTPGIEREPGPAHDGEPARSGTLYDWGTGAALGGAKILATAYHGTDDPLNAGYPALFQDVVEIQADGSFRLPIFDPGDPLLLAHLQIDLPGYLPEAVVLRRRDTVAAEWEEREIRLRPGLTGRVQIFDGTRPLARIPVRVTPAEDGHALMERETVEVARLRSERLVARGAPFIRHTDDAGYLRLPISENYYYLEALHPRYRLSHRDPSEKHERIGEVLCHVLDDRTERILALEGEPFVLTVYDADRALIADSELEISWITASEERTIRTLSDEDGRVDVWLTPPVRYLQPDDPDNATATVLTSAFFKRGVSFKLPTALNEVHVPSRPARRLELRVMAYPDDDRNQDPVPIAPEGIAAGIKGLTLVRRNAAGEVVFQGAVPAAGEVISLHLRGYLPLDVAVPPYIAESTSVDLGDVAFARGIEKKIVFEGVESSLLEAATLAVSPVDRPEIAQRYPLRGAKDLTIGGLVPGVYDIGVEGRYLRDYSSTFEVALADLDEPVTVSLRETDEETIVVRGRVVGGEPTEMARLTVIESYFVAGAPEPIVMKAYAPAPDGTIGSVRRLSGVTAVHLSVVSLEDDAVDLRLSREERSTLFDAGEVRLLPRPHAEITFFVPELGRLAPPRHVTLKAADGLEAHSRFRERHRRLWIDNLRDGLYQLSWAVGEGGTETFGFEVRGSQETRLQVARSLFAEEWIEVRVADSESRPVPEATLVSSASPSLVRGAPEHHPDPRGLEPGVKLARVRTREKSRLRAFVPEGPYLRTSAEVDPGRVVPTELILYLPASAVATVVDADGIEIDGIVSVSWEPKVPSTITHGDPFEVEVRNGRFRGDLFPPLPMRFTFRLAESETSITRVFSLPENGDPQDLGVLRFEETRALRGVVLLPDGSPAPGVIVALLDYDKAWRFPMRDPRDYDRVRYKAETDVQGAFTIEELPLDLSADLVLVAHKDGFGDAYEFPLDREIESRELQLDLAAGLELDVGYRDGLVRDQFRFSLEYQADPADPESRVDLGEIPAQLFGLNTFPAIEPGVYRVKWGLRDFYDPIPPLSEEVIVEPGAVVSLALLLDGRELRGKASINGVLVTTGWVLLSEVPGISAGTRVGRIVDGRFLMIDPPGAIEVFGAVIPESKPQAIQNIARGEALPARIHGYTASLRNGFLSFDYTAYNLKLRFSDEFLARYPGAQLVFPHYEWSDGRFASYRDSEPITSPLVRFHLLPPGIQTFTVRSERGALLLSRPISLSAGTVQLPDGRTLVSPFENEVLMR